MGREFVLGESNPSVLSVKVDCRLAMMELRIVCAGLIMTYKDWEGVADISGQWDKEMEPVENITIHPRNEKLVLRLMKTV